MLLKATTNYQELGLKDTDRVSRIYLIIVTLEMIVQVLQCAAPYLNTMSQSPYITRLKITLVCLSHIADLNHTSLLITYYYTLIIIILLQLQFEGKTLTNLWNVQAYLLLQTSRPPSSLPILIFHSEVAPFKTRKKNFKLGKVFFFNKDKICLLRSIAHDIMTDIKKAWQSQVLFTFI